MWRISHNEKKGEKDREHYDNNAAEAANWQSRFTKMTESRIRYHRRAWKYVSNADDDDDVNLIRMFFAPCSIMGLYRKRF